MVWKPSTPFSELSGSGRSSVAEASASTAWRKARRIVVAVVGGTLLFLGVLLLVLPGPAFIVIPAALAILALEFRWARRWLRKTRSLLPNRTRRKNHGRL